MNNLWQKTWRHWRQERRLPGRLANSAWVVFPEYLAFRVRKWLYALFPGSPPACLVVFPIARIRYRFHLLYLLSLAYPKIVVFWDAGLPELCHLQTEGRYLFRLRRVRFASSAAFDRISRRLARFDLVRAAGSPEAAPARTTRLFEIDTDLSRAPAPHSYLIPYCPHPQNFGIPLAARKQNHSRRVRVFFSGNVGFVKDPELVRQRFRIPSRDSTTAHLRRTFPQALWLETPAQRAKWRRDRARHRLVFATAKGDPRDWLHELGDADFFLCLPGSHMPMCHNAIEAMMAGAIPILAYADWFSPHLRNGIECLTYRSLDELDEAIERAVQMDEDSVRTMQLHVRAYHDRFLDLDAVSRKIFGPQNPRRHQRLYLNQEDCDNLSAAGPDSVRLNGGALQQEL